MQGRSRTGRYREPRLPEGGQLWHRMFLRLDLPTSFSHPNIGENQKLSYMWMLSIENDIGSQWRVPYSMRVHDAPNFSPFMEQEVMSLLLGLIACLGCGLVRGSIVSLQNQLD